jgi:hypothetical protein
MYPTEKHPYSNEPFVSNSLSRQAKALSPLLYYKDIEYFLFYSQNYSELGVIIGG